MRVRPILALLLFLLPQPQLRAEDCVVRSLGAALAPATAQLDEAVFNEALAESDKRDITAARQLPRERIKAALLWTRAQVAKNGGYFTVEMKKEFRGEEVPNNSVWEKRPKGVRYFSADEREKFRVQVREGKLMGANRKPLTTAPLGVIFVMDEKGAIYVSSGVVSGVLHHSSLLAGGPIAGAGIIKVENGIVTYIDSSSGHYAPDSESLVQVLERLDAQGADLGHLKISFVHGVSLLAPLTDPLGAAPSEHP